MDFTESLKVGGASATILLIIGITVKVFQVCINHRLRSECCGREASLAVSVESVNSDPKQVAT